MGAFWEFAAPRLARYRHFGFRLFTPRAEMEMLASLRFLSFLAPALLVFVMIAGPLIDLIFDSLSPASVVGHAFFMHMNYAYFILSLWACMCVSHASLSIIHLHPVGLVDLASALFVGCRFPPFPFPLGTAWLGFVPRCHRPCVTAHLLTFPSFLFCYQSHIAKNSFWKARPPRGFSLFNGNVYPWFSRFLFSFFLVLMG